MRKVCVFLVLILAVTFFVSGQQAVFAGGDQNKNCHEERTEDQSRAGNEDAGGQEEQKREQAKDE